MVVVVLPGVYQSHFDGGHFVRGLDDGRDLHEIRPGAGDDGKAEYSSQKTAFIRRLKSPYSGLFIGTSEVLSSQRGFSKENDPYDDSRRGHLFAAHDRPKGIPFDEDSTRSP